MTVALRSAFERDRVAFGGGVSPAIGAFGANGVRYSAGDVVTGADLRELYLSNGFVKVAYDVPSNPAEQTLAHFLYLDDGAGGWSRAVGAQYGDWSYYLITGTVPFDRATVIESSDDAVEIEFQVDAYAVGAGVYERREDGSLVYPASSPTPRQFSTVVLTKPIRVQRDEVGYYVGWHSHPRVGPGDRYIPAHNHYTDYGERELGFPNNAVAFSSASVTTRHPAFGQTAAWTAVEASLGVLANHAAWMGVCDPTGAVSPTYYADPLYIAAQPAGFPATQSAGPYWVAGIDNAIDVARVICLREPLEIGVWQFGSQSGIVVLHFTNEMHSPAGIPFRHQAWIGAVAHTPDRSAGYANEPTTALRNRMAAIAGSLNWPVH